LKISPASTLKDAPYLAKLAAGRHNILKERLTQVAWHRC
jgi:hypothetical protein